MDIIVKWMKNSCKAPREKQDALTEQSRPARPGQRLLKPQDTRVSDHFGLLREKIKPLQPGVCVLTIRNIFQKLKVRRLFQENKIKENVLAVGLPSGKFK